MAITPSLQIQHPTDGSWRDLTCDALGEISYSYGIRSNNIADRTGTTGQLSFNVDNDFRLSQYSAWWTSQLAHYASHSGGGPYIPNLNFTAAGGKVYDFFNYQTLDSDGGVFGDYWFQVGNRVRLMEHEGRVASTKDGAYTGHTHESVVTSDAFGTRSCVNLPGASSVIDLGAISTDFSGTTGSLFVSLAATDGWVAAAAVREIARVYVDVDNWVRLYHSATGVVTMEYRAGAVTHSFAPVETFTGTSDFPTPVAIGLTWDSDNVNFYMSTMGGTNQFGGQMRLLGTVPTTGTWTGVPASFTVGAATTDGATSALKGLFSGCALWTSVVDPRNFFPVNHHLCWHPDFIMAISNSTLKGYWPFMEGTGSTAQEWEATPLYFKFSGRIKNIVPAPGRFGGNNVAVSAVDWFDDAATFKVRDIPPQVDVTMDEALLATVLYSASQPPGVILTTGAETYAFTATDTRKGVTVLSEIAKLSATEFGYAYMRGTLNSEGVPGMALVNESRHSRVTNTTSNFALTDDGTSDVIRTIEPSQDIGDLKNVIEIVTHPADVDTDFVVVSSLPASTVLEVPGRGSFIYAAKYLDSDNAFKVVGVSSLVSPVRNTDFEIHNSPTSDGTDLSNDFRQTMLTVFGANLLAYYILNDPPGAAFRNEADATGASSGTQPESSSSVRKTSTATPTSGGGSGSTGSGTTSTATKVDTGTYRGGQTQVL